MHVFRDAAGREWSLTISIATVKRIKALAGVNIVEEISNARLLERLCVDPVLLCDILYAICKPDADRLGVTDEQFGQALAGDAIEAATNAMLQELVDFFPTRRRAVLKKALAAAAEMDEAQLAAVEKKIDAMALVDAPLGDSATNSPESSE